MKLSEIKEHLKSLDKVTFELSNGESVPAHFHITEVGQITKNFIDCGGKVRKEEVVNFQLWSSVDLHHRLAPEKLLRIIEMAEKTLGLADEEIEVEYQKDTIGKFAVKFMDGKFILINKKTDCLALEDCGVPVKKVLNKFAEVKESLSCCGPNSSCC